MHPSITNTKKCLVLKCNIAKKKLKKNKFNSSIELQEIDQNR